MKNHLGTFINSGSDTGAGDASATGLHSIDAICNINKQPAILGGNPVRQQLCIIDGLLANGNSAGGSFDTRVDRLIMGTFAPIVDYLTAMRIMKDVMNKPDANNNLPKFLTNFDYAETDALDWNEYVPGSGTVAPPTGGSGGSAGGGRGGSSSAGGARGGGGAAPGGTSSAGGARGGSTSSAGGGSGGTSEAGSAATGGATAEGGTTTSGSTAGSTGATGGTGGAPTSATSASGGATATGGASARTATTASSAGGGAGTEATKMTSAQHATGKSGGGCSVAGVDRRATPWGAMLAFGAAMAGKFWRRVNGDDRSS